MQITRILRWVGLAAVVFAISGAVQAEWKFGGYTQARYNFWDGDLDSDDAFDLRRVQIKAEGPVSEETTIKLQVDLGKLDDHGGDVELRDALITRKLNAEWTGTLGLTSVPFGYEVPTSSSRRLALERSLAASKLFPGEVDTGLYFHYMPEKKGRPMASFGYGNGLKKWRDADSKGNEDTDSSALIARVQWPVGKSGVAGASYMMADRKREIDGVETDFGSENVLGLHVRYDLPKTWAFQAEYYDGELLDVDVDGWYAMAEYALPKAPATIFYRYDTFDLQQPQDFSRNTLGVAYELSKNERVTLQGERYDDYDGKQYTSFGLQYQVKY
ncbi:MAG: porin [Armatimonadia bacterium]